MTWYDGGLLPPRPSELKDGQIMGDQSGGVLFIGTKGKLMTGCYGRDPILLPESLDKDYVRPAPTLRRIIDAMEGGHELDWIRACKESPESRIQTSSNFDYSGPLNELVVMGNLAVRLQDLKRKLMWDGENMRITNISDTDEIRVVTTDKFTVIEGHPNFDTQLLPSRLCLLRKNISGINTGKDGRCRFKVSGSRFKVQSSRLTEDLKL